MHLIFISFKIYANEEYAIIYIYLKTYIYNLSLFKQAVKMYCIYRKTFIFKYY